MKLHLFTSGILGVVILATRGPAQTVLDGFSPDVDGNISAIALQADGRIIIGGAFSSVDGQSRSNLARLNIDGTLDPAFVTGTDFEVFALATQPDGKVVVGGFFTTLDGQPRNRIGRLNADGGLDLSFNPDANAPVETVAVQKNGKIVIGGRFSVVGGKDRAYVARLETNGSLDEAFNPGADGYVLSLLIQPEGRILLGGEFGMLAGMPSSRIARLRADGGVDPSFRPGPCSTVFSLALQPDGRILAGAAFVNPNKPQPNYLSRLNVDGSLDETFKGDADDYVWDIKVQPDGKILAAGRFTALAGQPRCKIGRLLPNGALDLRFNPGSANGACSIPNPGGGTINDIRRVVVQPDGKILVAGNFTNLLGRTRNHIGRLEKDGSLETTFNPGADLPARLVAVQPDGKILITGQFSTIAGQTGKPIVRLHPDGSYDAGFNPRIISAVTCLAVQPDGKILVGGFSRLFANPRPGFVRRHLADGRIDPSFYPGVTNFDDNVWCLAVQPDGRIIVGGNFTSVEDKPCARIVRLNADGTLDPSFNPGADDHVLVLATEPDGSILVGGQFQRLGGLPCNLLGRLKPNGLLDTNFHPEPGGDGPFAPPSVRCLLRQPDGKILAGGYFLNLGGQARPYLGRLFPDGSLDTNFNTSFPVSASVMSLALRTDGKVMVAGEFDALDGHPCGTIARLHPDGSVDRSFTVSAGQGADGYINGVLGVAIQSDGKTILVGNFSRVNGVLRTNIARLAADSVASETLETDAAGSRVIWKRSGAGPEIADVAFYLSRDGTNFNNLGKGIPTPSGWQLSGLFLPPRENIFLRATGRVSSGEFDGFAGLVESVAAVYRAQDLSRPVRLGDGAFRFEANDPALEGYAVLATTNVTGGLVEWTEVGSVTNNGGGSYQFTDTNAVRFPARYYRLKAP